MVNIYSKINNKIKRINNKMSLNKGRLNTSKLNVHL